MLRNTANEYGLMAIILHWVIAILFIGQLVLGLWMVRLDDQRLAFELIQWHKSFGFLLLALVAIRLIWWVFSRHPPLPADMSPLEKMAAHVAHFLLYCLMVLLPVTGWALASASVLAIPTFAFYLFIIPHLPLAASEQAEAFWDNTHTLLGYFALALVAIHILAALRHHFWLRDDLLKRMVWPAHNGPTHKQS
ncbi:MAG: cytochrome b [Phyllobacterium sp.]